MFVHSRDPLSSLERGRHARVGLELLEGLEWVDVGVGVVQADHEAHGHDVVVLEVVQERAAVRLDVLGKNEEKGNLEGTGKRFLSLS